MKPARGTPGPVRREQARALSAARPGVRLSLPLAAAILALTCLLAYVNSFRAELLLDSQTVILGDTRLRAMDWRSVRDIFAHHYWWPSLESDLYRPLTTLSYWFNYSVLGNGARPFGYHAVNLLLHWANTLLVFSLVRKVTGRPWVSLFTAAVLASHPVTVEAVTNVVGRADLLAGFAVLAGLGLYLRFQASAGSRSLAGSASLAGLGVVYLAGVFSKESAVVLPGLMLLHDAVFPPASAPTRLASIRRSLVRVWPAYVSLLPGIVLMAWARWTLFHASPLPGQFGSDNPIAIASFWTGVMTAVKVIGYYLALLVWPANLSCDYSYNQVTLFGWTLMSGQDGHAWMAAAALVGVFAWAAASWRRDRGIAFFLGFAAVTFLPTSNLLFPIGTIMAERLMYLPLVGMTAAAALTLTLATRGQPAPGEGAAARRRNRAIGWTVVAVVTVTALIARTVERNEDWTSSLRLWTSSARAASDSVKVQRALARIAMESDPSGGRADEAIAIASRGLRIVEQAPLPLQHMPAALYEELGVYYSAKAQRAAEAGRSAEARALFGQVVTLLKQAEEIDREINRRGKERLLARGFDPSTIHDTGSPSIFRNLGSAYLAIDDPERAVETLRYLERIRPASDDAHYTRGVAEGALAEFERARGNLAQAREHMERAAVSLIQAILLNPANERSWQMLERAYAALATPPNPVQTIDGKRTLDTDDPLAARHFREACVQLVRQLDEGGVPEEAERWRRRLVTGSRAPTAELAPPLR